MKFFLLMIISLTLWANIGNIMAMKGSADVQRDSGTVVAKSGMPLLKGDEILTEKKSRVQVMLKDNTIVTIGASSSFSFEEFAFDGTQNSEVSMQANRGFFRALTGKIGKLAPERFKVKTASATIGIRGTDFSGEIFGDRELFKCYEGAIFVEFDGRINHLDAGMLMEILQNRFKIREFDTDRELKPKEENQEVAKGEAAESSQESQIPTESISDVTQIISDAANSPERSNESFDVDPNSEDRPVSY